MFGGGMGAAAQGSTVVEKNLDRITITVGLLWVAAIAALLALYRYFPDVGTLG